MGRHTIYCLLFLLLLLASCSGDLSLENSSEPEPVVPPVVEEPVVEEPVTEEPALPEASATGFFLLDFKNGTSRNLTTADLSGQSFYEHDTGVSFAFSVPVTDLSYPGIYSATVTISNKSGQAINLNNFPIDTAQLIISSFAAQDESGQGLEGGGIANSDGYKAESLYPFLWIKHPDEVAEVPEFQTGIKRVLDPDESISRSIDISLPQAATQVLIEVQLLAESMAANNIPVAGNAYATVLAGSYGEAGASDGLAHQAKLNLPTAAESCGGYLHIIENNSGIFKRYGNNSLETTNATYRISNNLGGLDCYKGLSDQLVIADTGLRQVYLSSSYSPAAISEVIGSGEVGQLDGDVATASFAEPVDVASLGKHIYVADSGSIRQISELDRNYYVTTVLAEQAGKIISLTTDNVKTVFYHFVATDPALSGIYALDTESLEAKLIWQNAAVKVIRWDGAAGLFASVAGQLYHLSPVADAWSATLAAGSETIASIAGGKMALEAYLGEIGYFDVDAGTLYLPSSNNQQVIRIDRLR
ncbi:MAG: hypothetical protein KC422_14470 [Trueperaceae bacterium]|nr:hypothetical protein [Trueperaceae bacterium]